MSTSTPRLALIKPAPSENMWDVNNHLDANLDKLDAGQPFFRDTTLPAFSYNGHIAVASGQGDATYSYDGSGWRQLLKTQAYVAANENNNETDITTTSTSYVASLTVVSCTFTAPQNGLVWINLSGIIENSGTFKSYLSFEVRETDAVGAVHLAANDRRALIVHGSSAVQATRRVPITGLTPFTQTYYAQLMVRSENAAGTMTAFWRKIEAEVRR